MTTAYQLINEQRDIFNEASHHFGEGQIKIRNPLLCEITIFHFKLNDVIKTEVPSGIFPFIGHFSSIYSF